jgi:hypothetical protein
MWEPRNSKELAQWEDVVAREARSISVIQVVLIRILYFGLHPRRRRRRRRRKIKMRVRIMRRRKIMKERMNPMLAILSLFLDVPGIRRTKKPAVASLLRDLMGRKAEREAIEFLGRSHRVGSCMAFACSCLLSWLCTTISV